MSLRKAVACVRKNNNFLITAHTNLEGDALGSELAFCRMLKKLGKNAVIMNEDLVPYSYSFLPDTDKIIKYKDNLRGIKFDCFVVLDCSDLARTGEVWRINNKDKKPVLNVDHHISNVNFGTVNWVNPHASSCSEMVYEIHKALGVEFDKEAALCLYVGIFTDTGSFRYSNTSSSTHKACAELLKYGLNVPGIYKKVYEDIPFEDMKLFAKILPFVRREAKGKIIWFQIKRKIFGGRLPLFDLSEHLLTFARSIKDGEVCLLFKENLGVKDEIRVNFRSQGKVDVNRIASCFGGGGHKTAAGATIRGKIEQVRKKVLAKVKESLRSL